jgi:hypothetical protein
MKKIFIILLCATSGLPAMLDRLREPQAGEPLHNCRFKLPNALMSAGLVSSVGGAYCLMKAMDHKYNFFTKYSESEKIKPNAELKYLLAGIALKTVAWGILIPECNKNEFALLRLTFAESASSTIGLGLYALQTAYLKYHHAKKECHMIKELRQQEALKEFAVGASCIMMGLIFLPLPLLECD